MARLARWMLVGLVVVAASCSGGPIGVGPLPLSGDSIAEAQVHTCLSSPGRLHISVDSSATFEIIRVEINDEATGGEDFDVSRFPGSFPGHAEGTSTKVHPAGSCPNLKLKALCYPNSTCDPFPERTFHYVVSLVP